MCAPLEKAGRETTQPETRKPFGSISEAPAFGEEGTLTEISRATFGLWVAAAFGFFAPNWLCSHWKWKTPARWDPSTVMLSCDWICFYKRGRLDHWVFRVLSTNRSETEADVGLHLVCGSMATGVIRVRCFLYLWMLLLTPICNRAPLLCFKASSCEHWAF